MPGNHVVIEAHDRCSTCAYSELNPQDMNLVNCWGSPPIPIVLGGQQMAGQVQLNVQVLRPVAVPRHGRGCALHKKKTMIEA